MCIYPQIYPRSKPATPYHIHRVVRIPNGLCRRSDKRHHLSPNAKETRRCALAKFSL